MHTSTAAETGKGASGRNADSYAAAGSSPSASAANAPTSTSSQPAAAHRRRSSVAGDTPEARRRAAASSAKRVPTPGLSRQVCSAALVMWPAPACSKGANSQEQRWPGWTLGRSPVLPRQGRISLRGLRRREAAWRGLSRLHWRLFSRTKGPYAGDWRLVPWGGLRRGV